MPVGDVRDDDEVDEDWEELVCCQGYGITTNTQKQLVV